MARVFWLVLLTPVVVTVGLVPQAEARPEAPSPDPKPGLRLGVLNGMFRDTPPALIQAVAQPFQALFKKQTGLGGTVEAFDDCETLAAKMKDKKIDFGVFHGFEFAWVRGRYPELVPLVTTVPAMKPQAVIVVKADSKAKEPKDLTGACVALPLGTKAHCHLFIERLQENLPAGCCCPNKKGDCGSEDVLDAVAEGKAPAALVDVAALAAYQDNKPGKGTQLRPLCKSDPFPPTVVVYRKDAVDANVVAKIKKGLVDAKHTSQGKAFMFLWKLQGFEAVTAQYEAELAECLKAYPSPAPQK